MQQQEDFRLTEEEFMIINTNEKIANKLIIQNEQIFKALLNEYFKNQRNEQYEASDVPNDGSCLYHAILHSFAAKYGQQLEIDHQKMREQVAIHMLRGQEKREYLRNFAMNENDNSSSNINIIDMSNSSKKKVQKRYIKYAQSHMNNTHHWPIELCLHIVAELYNLDVTVLQEALDPNVGQPSGYICERLRSVAGLLLTTTTSSSSSSTSTSTILYPQLLSSSPPPPPPPLQPNSREIKAIVIGNRWDQHYYSIGIILIVVVVKKHNSSNNVKLLNTNKYIVVPMIADDQEYKEKNSKLIEQQGQQQQHEDLISNITSTLTAEEKQKASSRREKDLERKKRLRIKQKAEIQAYEESLVLARKLETDDKIDEPTHILQQVISNNHHQSPASNKSSSKEEIKDPLEIRTSKFTEEERRKKARREKAREQSKQRKI